MTHDEFNESTLMRRLTHGKICRTTMLEAGDAIEDLQATIKRVSEIPAKLRDDFSRGGMPTGALEAICYIEEALEQRERAL